MRPPTPQLAPLIQRAAAQRPSQPPSPHVKLLLTILFAAPLLLAAAESEPAPLNIDKVGGSGHNAP